MLAGGVGRELCSWLLCSTCQEEQSDGILLSTQQCCLREGLGLGADGRSRSVPSITAGMPAHAEAAFFFFVKV